MKFVGKNVTSGKVFMSLGIISLFLLLKWCFGVPLSFEKLSYMNLYFPFICLTIASIATYFCNDEDGLDLIFVIFPLVGEIILFFGIELIFWLFGLI